MELYGTSQGKNKNRNGSQSAQPKQHQPQWSQTGGGTSPEEPASQMGRVASGEAYPERPGVPDCVYYLRTGSCGYGDRCRFNHPRNRAAVEAALKATGDYPERPGEPSCQFYLKTGTCKFGAACKFDHPKHGVGSLSPVPLNIHGYPLRPEEKECSHYVKRGQCKFGMTCKFHHPQPARSSISASAPQFHQQVQSPSVPVPDQYSRLSTIWRLTPPALPGSYMQGSSVPVLFSPGMVPFTGWSPYSVPVSPAMSPVPHYGIGATSIYGITPVSSSMPALAGPYPFLPSSAGHLISAEKQKSSSNTWLT